MAPRLTRITTWAPWIAVLVAAIVAYALLVSEQGIKTFWDSQAYLETAQRPFSAWHFFYPKPVLVPVIYRWFGADTGAIARMQEVLALIAWVTLAAALALALERRRARIAAVVAGALFLFHPLRIGFTDSILSESIDDSLTALGLAALLAAIALPRARRWLVVAFAVIATAWLLVRDTNAIIALAAAPICAWVWRRDLRARVRELACAAWLVLVSVFALWSTGVTPPPTGLSFHGGWPDNFLARHTYSTMNDVFDRVLPDPDATAFFVERGLPQVDELRALTWHQNVLFDAKLAPATTWIATRGRGVYEHWLLAHPLARTWELVDNMRILVGADDHDNRHYMPPYWRAGRLGPRDLLSNRWVLGALALAWLAACRWSRRRDLVWLATCLVVAGWIGSAAAYYGDSSELARHCYGSGQLIVLGLVVAALTLLDARGINDQ